MTLPNTDMKTVIISTLLAVTLGTVGYVAKTVDARQTAIETKQMQQDSLAASRGERLARLEAQFNEINNKLDLLIRMHMKDASK
jgi:Ni,Fe-hydrogenase III large subunit